MYGVCIELKTSCKHCSSPLMLNAMAEDFFCQSCSQINHFSMEKWKDLLEDQLNDIHEFKLGEGQPSTVMSGEYSYNMLTGRQNPRCRKCKQDIDLSKIEEYSGANHVKCSKCSNTIFVRKPTDEISGILPRIKYLIGEDEDLLSSAVWESKKGDVKNENLPDSDKPVLFTCPSCAGNLEVDGSDRIVVCKYCSSQIYLPDDLWFRLHPAETVQRWYIMYSDEQVKYIGSTPVKEKMQSWYYLSDITIDRDGNLYIASSENSEKDFIVWSIGHDLGTRWIKDGLKFNHDSAGITLANDGNLYLWDKKKHSLLKLSSANGEVLQKIEGEKSSSSNHYPFNLKGCSTLVSFPDSSVLALVNNVFARFGRDGERVQLWEGKWLGLFGSGLGKKIPESDSEYAPRAGSILSYPKRADSDFTRMNFGWDGKLYMTDRTSDGKVAVYDTSGRRLGSYYHKLRYCECKPCADKNGNIYMLGTTEDSLSRLIKIDPETGNVEVLLKDILEGGVLNQEDNLALAPDGTIYVLKYYNRIKVFSPDLKMIYISDQCREDDEEKLNEKKEAVENDEEF